MSTREILYFVIGLILGLSSLVLENSEDPYIPVLCGVIISVIGNSEDVYNGLSSSEQQALSDICYGYDGP